MGRLRAYPRGDSGGAWWRARWVGRVLRCVQVLQPTVVDSAWFQVGGEEGREVWLGARS